MAADLPKTAIKKIHAAVDKLLDRAKARVLGNPKQDKRIYVGVRPRVTLPQLYAAAASAERALADKSHLHSLMSIAESYIESQRAIIKAKVEASVRAFLAEADAGGIDTDAETVLGGQLADVWKKATSDMTKIVATESNAAKNVGVMEGIVKINAASGIEDPIVYFVVVHDDDLCDECKRLHLMEDEVTPRLWFLSEVKQGYHKKTDDAPSLLGEHPHCRCTPVTLMPGYGFVGGHAEFIELGHNEMAKQRAVEKAEPELDAVEKAEPELEPLQEELSAPALAPLLGNDGKIIVGDKNAYRSFSRSKPAGVFVAFKSSGTGLSVEELHKHVVDATQEVAVNGRIFVTGKTFKIFVGDRSQADDVVRGIQSRLLDEDDDVDR